MSLKPPIPPMEARSVEEIPTGEEWQYEPKWDGFRCLAFRDGDKIFLQSKNGQPLARYFPDVVSNVAKLPQQQFVLDGELVIPIGGALSFDELQLRLHPAASRVQKLAAAHPAVYVVFDVLAEGGKSYLKLPLRERRQLLEKFARSNLRSVKGVRLSPATTDLSLANEWFKRTGGDLDGIIAKRMDAAYASGERTAAVKIKQIRTADCVVGGFRYATRQARHWFSFARPVTEKTDCSITSDLLLRFKASERRELTKKFEATEENHPVSPATRLEDRAVGARSAPANGNQSRQKLSWKSPMIILPAAGFDTAQDFCAGVPTKILANARWTRWSIAKERRWLFCKPLRFSRVQEL